MGSLRTLYHLKLFSVERDENIIVFCDEEKTEENKSWSISGNFTVKR